MKKKTLLPNPIAKIRNVSELEASERSSVEQVNKNHCVCGHWKAKNTDKCISCLSEEKFIANDF